MGEFAGSAGFAGNEDRGEFRRRTMEIVDEIVRHKWLESEKAGCDIGGNAAAIHWMDHHYELWKKAKGY